MQPDLHGIMSAVFTPMNADGTAVDGAAYARLLKSQADSGVHAVVIAGTTGEHSTLSVAERKLLCETAVQTLKGRIPIIAQVGATNTRDSLELARHAMATGADRLMAVAPYYDRLRWSDLQHYLGQVAEIAGQPIVYYHTPRVTGLDLTEDELVTLAQQGLISHIKDSAGDFARTVRLMLRPDGPKVIAGNDPSMMAALVNGAVGSILGASTFIPEICVELYRNAVEKRDLPATQAVWKKLWPILNVLLLNGYVALTKAGAEMRGMPVGAPREPLLPSNAETRALLKRALDDAGIGNLAKA